MNKISQLFKRLITFLFGSSKSETPDVPVTPPVIFPEPNPKPQPEPNPDPVDDPTPLPDITPDIPEIPPVEQPEPEEPIKENPVIIPLPKPDPVEPKPTPIPPAAQNTGMDLDFNFGMAVKDPLLKNEKYQQVVRTHCRQVTLEYQTQMHVVHPDAKTWNFKAVDKMVDWLKAEKKTLHVHTSLWPDKLKLNPQWETLPKTKDAFNKQLKSDIYTYVGYFKKTGIATSIDVWNEFFAEGKVGVPKPNIIIDNMGMDGFYRAFHYVKETDPNIKNFLNDYGQEFGGNKVKGMLDIIDECKKRNVPLDGIGFQMHLTLPMLKKDKLKTMKENVLKFADKGMLIHFSEHDVKLFKDIDGNNIRNAQKKVDLTKDMLEQQSELSFEVREIFRSVPKPLQWGFKTWGVDDETHNDNLKAAVNNDFPVFFDNELNPKPVFEKFLS